MSSYITGALQIMQGVSDFKAAKQEGKDLRRQGAVALRESEAEAERVGEQGRRFGQRQRLSFLKQGVRLECSPLLILAETAEKSAEEVAGIQRRGQAQAQLFRSRGQITERGGRSRLLGSFASASASFVKGSGELESSKK